MKKCSVCNHYTVSDNCCHERRVSQEQRTLPRGSDRRQHFTMPSLSEANCGCGANEWRTKDNGTTSYMECWFCSGQKEPYGAPPPEANKDRELRRLTISLMMVGANLLKKQS